MNALAPAAASPQDLGGAHPGIIKGWVRDQLHPWIGRGLDRAVTAAAFQQLHDHDRRAYIYDIDRGEVRLWTKPAAIRENPHHPFMLRASGYGRLFRKIAAGGPPGLRTRLCVSMDDGWIDADGVPTFSYQKVGGDSILLVDPDFLLNEFYEDPSWKDALCFDAKRDAAIFVGSTTGCMLSADAVHARSSQRLSAGEFFHHHPDVTFRLPSIVQYADDDARTALMELPFCGGERFSWPAQLAYRYLISMDGNGATCSRVALALASRSVLLKYASPYTLYYFAGLEAWRHFVPVSTHQEVVEVLQTGRNDPEAMRAIAAAGSQFANDLLTRAPVTAYVSALVHAYEAAFTGGEWPEAQGEVVS